MKLGNKIGISFGTGQSWSSYWTALTPALKTNALFWLNGEISQKGENYYYKDISGNKRDFLITGRDWTGDTRVSGNFPFKTVATISAPANDAVLIAADVNNFLYDAEGSPNALCPQNFFQNIDYINTLFCKHEAATLNASNEETKYSGVKDIVLYSAAKTGDDLSACVTYFSVPDKVTSNVLWVAKSGNDSTGDGSEAKPYKTIDKAIISTANGATKTIYVKTGDYNEATSGVDYLYKSSVYNNKKVTLYGTGRTRITSANATYAVRWADTGECHLTGIEIYGSQTQPLHASFNAAPSNLNRCKFNSGTVYVVATTVNKCCFNNSSIDTYSDVNAVQTVSECYLNAGTLYMYNRGLLARKSVCKYNKFKYNNVAGYCASFTGTYFDVNYNVASIVASLGFFRTGYYNTAAGVANFNYNDVTIDTGQVISVNTANIYTSFTANNNRINHTSLTDKTALLYTAKYITTLTIEHNHVTSVSKNGFMLVEMTPVTGTAVTISIKYNYLNTKSTTEGAIISFSESGVANVYDGAEIMYNYIKGGIVENYTETLNVHAILARSGKNMKIAYNWIENCAIGIVYKNEGVANTTGGIYGNVLINNRVDIYLRGCNEARVYNNVCYKDNAANNTNSYFVTADFQVSNNTNCFFENNIFVRFNSKINVALFNLQAASLAAGTKLKRNIVYCPDFTDGHWLYDGTDYYSLAQSVTNGYAENIDSNNPSIIATRPYPVTPIPGATDLGAAFDDGLNINSVWTEAINLVQQGANWQFGAFVQ